MLTVNGRDGSLMLSKLEAAVTAAGIIKDKLFM